MNSAALIAAVAVMTAVPAFAGGIADTAASPQIVPAVPVSARRDWSGFQAGLVLGTATTTTRFSPQLQFDLDSMRYGLIARYLQDTGDVVLGGQLMYEEIRVENDTVEGMTRFGASLLAGYDMGRLLPHAHLGIVRLDTGEIGTTETGSATASAGCSRPRRA
ncbi:hypothetical protein HKCCSP123_18020 [Rhodobacterales bacterium HKCCSP123]|nr:hypothetical protein [Rhodobacterales bacterium HKCCSP123]